jgi:hypothetical protein
MFGVCRGCCRSACIVTRIDDPHWENAVVWSEESPAKRCRRRHNAAAAAAHRASWISVADQKRRFEAGLWYQNMSRVRPECPQTTPREERKASCIRKAYGEHPGAKVEPFLTQSTYRTGPLVPNGVFTPVPGRTLGHRRCRRAAWRGHFGLPD